jgi:hypothetical protein
MANSNEFRIIENRHLQSLLKIPSRRATNYLQEVRDHFKKPNGSPVYLWELCTYMKLDIDKVCAFFN